MPTVCLLDLAEYINVSHLLSIALGSARYSLILHRGGWGTTQAIPFKRFWGMPQGSVLRPVLSVSLEMERVRVTPKKTDRLQGEGYRGSNDCITFTLNFSPTTRKMRWVYYHTLSLKAPPHLPFPVCHLPWAVTIVENGVLFIRHQTEENILKQENKKGSMLVFSVYGMSIQYY